MTGSTPNIQQWSDKDYLELLMYKLKVMKEHGAAFYARKMKGDELLFNEAKKDVNQFLTLLKKRGYNGDRFSDLPKYEQQHLF